MCAAGRSPVDILLAERMGAAVCATERHSRDRTAVARVEVLHCHVQCRKHERGGLVKRGPVCAEACIACEVVAAAVQRN